MKLSHFVVISEISLFDVILCCCRAIFRWMTTKNLYTIMFDSELPGSPEQVIGAFKDGKTTYAKIFECLCVYVKLILCCEIFVYSCFCN